MNLASKKILVTGGTGSFGQAFCRYIFKNEPRIAELRVFSRDEQKQFDMMRDPTFAGLPIEYILGDIKDPRALNFAAKGVDIIIHAAAMKHVPMTEKNPLECFKTNILGSQNLIDAAIANQVQKVVALSTDKAVNPIGAYGASKLALEALFMDADRRLGDTCTFSVVRYGNIFASKGSVVPVFLSMRNQGHLAITDPESTRFSITLQDSIDLVLYALEGGIGGEVVLPIAPSFKLLDLANAVDADIEKRVIGLRPSEKRHETLFSESEAPRILTNRDFFILIPETGRRQSTAYCEATGAKPAFKTGQLCSSSNHLWLSTEELRTMIATHYQTEHHRLASLSTD